jgi:hypothetical protein
VAAGVSTFAAGGFHSLFVKTDGTLWAMGSNGYGGLGDGTGLTRFSPVQIAVGVAAVAAGYTHSSFLKNDGTLWAMGNNAFGQLGDGTTTPRYAPVQVASNVFSVTAGGWSTYFVQAAGVGVSPTVATQPVGGSFPIGASLKLTAAATGTGPLDFRWQKHGVDLPGARSAVLDLPFLQLSDDGNYTAVVTNSAGVSRPLSPSSASGRATLPMSRPPTARSGSSNSLA